MSHIPLKVEVLGEQGIKRREAGCDAVATGRYFRHRESECHLVCNSHITDPPPTLRSHGDSSESLYRVGDHLFTVSRDPQPFKVSCGKSR